MANKIIAERALTDIVTAGVEAYSIASLLMWINEARALIERVRDCASIYPDLREGLQRANVRLGSAQWGEETAEGMDMLLLNHRSTIDEMKNAAESIDVPEAAEQPKAAQASARSNHALRQALVRPETRQTA